MYFLNLGSLVLGLVSWIAPFMGRKKLKADEFIPYRNMFISLSAVIISLLFQIMHQNHLVNIGDWSAVDDTMNAVKNVATFLSVTTIAINVLVFFSHKKELEEWNGI